MKRAYSLANERESLFLCSILWKLKLPFNAKYSSNSPLKRKLYWVPNVQDNSSPVLGIYILIKSTATSLSFIIKPQAGGLYGRISTEAMSRGVTVHTTEVKILPWPYRPTKFG